MWQKHSSSAAQGHAPRDFRVAFGSCAYVNDPPFDRSSRPSGPYGGGYAIFDSIARMKPDMMLWLGDNIYLRDADVGSPGRHRAALPPRPRVAGTAAPVAHGQPLRHLGRP
jgi:phosphodiesterase/alkaline phosphatase D-like protein